MKEAEFLVVIAVVSFVVTFGGNYIDQMEMGKNILKSFFTSVTAAIFGAVYYLFRNVK